MSCAKDTGAPPVPLSFVDTAMRNRNRLFLCLICAICLCADKPAAPDTYMNDFEQAALGKPSDEFLILNGTFTVVQVDGNKCLELAADPLDGDGLLFGPPGRPTGGISARIWGSATGKRFPEFGVGAFDGGGYKLMLVPAQGILELRKGDDSMTSSPYPWKSETWTRFRMRITKLADGKFQIDGKAWPDGSPEPAAWSVSAQDTDAPSAGRASAWGMPYSGKPIRFDDLGYKPQ